MALFDLPQSSAELVSANQGTANARYQQITATRNVGINSFGSGGTIQYRWETGGNTWFVPDKSYFRIRCTISQVRVNAGPALPPLCSLDTLVANGGIAASGNVAPNMGLAANLFKTVEVLQNGKTIERVGERLAQIDALKTRMCKSKAWMDSIGQATNFWGYDFEKRRNEVCVDGYSADEKTYQTQYLGLDLTKLEAGFGAGTTITMIGGENLITFSTDDIAFGKMALRPGDVIRAVAGGDGYRVQRIVSATTCTVEPLHDADDNGFAGDEFTIQKLANATRNDATGKNSFEIIWQPPLGFFDLAHAIPPGGVWTVEFDPENVTQFKQNALQSLNVGLRLVPPGGVQANNLAGDVDFSVDQMYLYLYTVDASRFDNGAYFLDIQNVRCQQENMNTVSTALVQKNFDVSGKTNALTLAFQDQAAGTSTQFSRSLFKIRPGANAAAGGVGSQRGQDLLLNRFYISYNHLQKPSPDFDGQYTQAEGDSLVNEFNQLTQRYADTMMQAGAYHTEGGAESFQEWINRGPYYHFLWPKDAVENNTRVNINFQFSQAFGPANANHTVLLFNWWRTAYHIVHVNGRVDRMTVEEL